MLWLLALAGRADACTVYVSNTYNVSLTLNSYNGWDNSCLDYWAQYTVGGDGGSTSIVFPCRARLHDQPSGLTAIISPT
jgi:hypothetical protein